MRCSPAIAASSAAAASRTVSGAAVGSAALCWPPQAGATVYEVAQSTDASFTSCTRTEVLAPDTCVDVAAPPPREVFYLLVRALAPHTGSWGFDGAGTERGEICP